MINIRHVNKMAIPENALEKSSSNELFSNKNDVFTKSLRKKYQVIEHTAVNSTANLTKTFSKNRVKQSYPPKESPSKQVERSSNSRNHNSRQVEKISLTAHAYHQANAIATTSKLLKIANIFCRKIEGQPQQMLSQLYEQNDEYLQLLCEWQKLEIYDEIDKLVYRISQSYTNAIETILSKAYKQMDIQLQGYETAIRNLQEQKTRLKEKYEQKDRSESMFGELKERLAEEYRKNQWGSIILEAIGRANFDLEAFVKKISVYRSLISQKIVEMEEYIPDEPESSPRDKQIDV